MEQVLKYCLDNAADRDVWDMADQGMPIIFSSPEPKAHSGSYRILMVRCPSVRPQCSKNFFSKTPWPIKAKFYVEPPWVGGTKVCSRHLVT